YDDGVISGSEVETRREMVRLISDIQAGRIKIVLCIEFSRLSRDDSMGDSLNFLNLCAEKAVKIATPERLLDPTDTASWFLALMEGGFSAVEIKTLKKRIREGQQVARSKGRWLGGIPPYGYRYNRDTRMLVAHPENAKNIRTIFHERVVNGTSVDSIVKTARNHGWATPRGGVWVSCTIHRLLRNPVYSGFVKFQGKLVPAAAETLIDQATWNAAQSCRVRPPGRRQPALMLTGRGRVRCGYCGSNVNCASSTWYRKDGTKGNTHRYYHCYGRHLGVPCRTLRTIPNWELEGVVLGVLAAICEHRNEILDGIQAYLTSLQGALPEQRKSLEAQLRAVIAAEDKLLRAYEAGAISLEQLKARNEANRQQSEATQKDIMALDLRIARQGGDFSRARLEEGLDRFREKLEDASFEELRELVDPLVSGVTLFNEKAEVTFSFPLDGEAKHEFSLPGTSVADDLAPGSVVGRRVLTKKARFPGTAELNRLTLGGVLADPRYKVAFARASLS
ncbi:recombinase family protein, partial [bacterium]